MKILKGHLSIHGALRYSKNAKPFEGNIGPESFSSLKRTFSGDKYLLYFFRVFFYRSFSCSSTNET